VTPGWVLCHVVMIALVITFLRLGWWQLTRAEGGNGLSIGYTMEWPLFSAFVVAVWLREVRSTLRAGRPVDATVDATVTTPAPAPGVPIPTGVSRFDPEAERAARAARSANADPHSDYNQYLASLATRPNARFADYRRPEPKSDEENSPA
jgi:hypothetical protein